MNDVVIGVPKEIKKEEYRVGLTPSGAADLRRSGHTLLVEAGAGLGSGFSDDEYLDADADIVSKEVVFDKAELIVKVKEPLREEYGLLKKGQALFTFLHLAPNRDLTELLLAKKITAIGYETVEKDGSLPLLAPMSEIAGRMAPLAGAFYLQAVHGGRGLLPTGVAGVKPAKALVLGAGVVGSNAVRVCLGLGMETLVLNRGTEKLRRIDELFCGRAKTMPLSSVTVCEEIIDADIIICAMLVPGEKAPVLITKSMLGSMKKGAVIVDVSIDQGGCTETSIPTTHDSPTYRRDGIIHYCVANMPGAYPRTSTLALTNATLPCIRIVATMGIQKAIDENTEIKSGLNTYKGSIVHPGLSKAAASG